MKTITQNLKKMVLLLTLVFGIAALISAQSKTIVKPVNLQKNITDQIAKNYSGYAIVSAFKVDNKKVISYEVNVEKEHQMMCLSFDKNGKFLKAAKTKNKTGQLSSLANKSLAMISEKARTSQK
jgi:hypothetical protein